MGTRGATTAIPKERYVSREFADLEHARLWPRVWQIACTVDHVAEPGDWFEYRCGWISVVIVRGDDGVLRAFQNVCRHRGNILCEGAGAGLTELRCPFHRWAWDLTGQLREIPSRAYFGPLTDDDTALVPVPVDTWGRLVFVNLDRDSAPLATYLHGTRIGVLVQYEGDETAARDVAMHVAAMKPVALAATDVPAALVDKERSIATQKAAEDAEKARAEGKPVQSPEIVAKRVEGSVAKYLKEVSLHNQAFVKNDKQTVEQMLKEKGTRIHAFTLYVVGEGIEKKTGDFAAEVAAQVAAAKGA